MSITKIVTHPGSAHKDDFLACAILLAGNPVPVMRKEPVPEELTDPSVCVVDVGHEHDPAKRNFDHHQFPKDHPPTCSVSLVLQDLGLYEDALQFCDWLEPAEWFDCRGPVNTAKWLGVSREVLSRLSSPIDITLLRRFSMAGELHPGDPIWEVMRMIGEDLVRYISSLRERLEFISKHSEVWEISVDGGSFEVLFMPRTESQASEPSWGLGQYIQSRGWQRRVVGMAYPDRRGPGYGLSRFNDDRRLDFTRIAEDSEVHFAHKQGFVAKMSTVDPERLKALLAMAWVGGRAEG